ncbi:MAG: ATP-dependent helicase [Candidatus Omnitrophica bacterium]|nr:ATP-dependent helicase [Candidatus Omnitrophota bacterium]
MIDISKELNPSQLEAVDAIDGPVLVIAGAGSGKTRVIEYRVLNLIQKNVLPQSILLLTFTRKAASQMLARASRHDRRCSLVEGGTFHSFAYRILKKYSKRLGFDFFTILDESDAENALNLCVGRLALNDKDKRFPRKDTLRKIISMSINKDTPIGGIIETEYPNFIDYSSAVERIADEYRRYKQEKGYFDYDDLLVYLFVCLSRYDDIRREISSRYRYVMVDEYQDTNKLQADIAYYLAKDHGNCMAVGDDAQSIYGFRGASHKNIMEFPKKFSGTRIIKLEANYRSSQPILDVANAVLRNMRTKFDKDLFSATEHRGVKPTLLFFQDTTSEAEWLGQKILDLRDEGVGFGDQAVLFRLPFQVFGGVKFYETSHVKDLLAHLRVILNPHDEISWTRLLELIEGIGPRTAAKVISSIEAQSGMQDIINNALRTGFDKNKYKAGLEKLACALDNAVNKCPSLGSKLSKLMDYYEPIFRQRFDDWNQRENDLAALKQISERYDSLQDFLAEFSIEPPDYGVAKAASRVPEDEKPLTLSTIHSAKGLEWECVFLMGLVDGILPVSFALEDESRIDEEHRLFYVGLTRAKSRLYLFVHHEANGVGMSGFNKVSRFLDSREVLAKLDQDIQVDYDF